VDRLKSRAVFALLEMGGMSGEDTKLSGRVCIADAEGSCGMSSC
jgi:hypothetical protein